MAKRFAYRTAIAGLAAVAVITPSIVAPNTAFADTEPAAEIAQPTPAKSQLKASPTPIAVGGFAKAENFVDAPAEATVNWKDNIAPTSDVPATIQGVIVVSFPATDSDATRTETHVVNVEFVEEDKNLADPALVAVKPVENAEVLLGVKPTASQFVQNAPEGAEVKWENDPATDKLGDVSANAVVKYTDSNGAPVTHLVPVTFKVVEAKKQNKGLILDGAVGLALSLGALLVSQIQIPGLKEANTKLQQKLGIFNPQIATTAEKAVGVVGGLAGLTGIILSIITIVDGVNGRIGDDVRGFQWTKSNPDIKFKNLPVSES